MGHHSMGTEKPAEQSSIEYKLAVFAALVVVVACVFTVLALSLALRAEINKNNLPSRHTRDTHEKENKNYDHIIEDICQNKILDVAIVGAGPSGSFAGWQLSKRYKDWRIGIFDANDRSGGRLYSITLPGVKNHKAELGAMRFLPEHDSLQRIIHQLGLKKVDFTSPNENNTLHYLRGRLLDKDDFESGNVPYDMTDEEREMSSDPDKLHVFWNNKILDKESQEMNDAFKKKCTDGKMAYEKGVYNALSEVASCEGMAFAFESSGFMGTGYGNENFAKINTERALNPRSHVQLHTIQEGFQEIVTRMLDRFEENLNNKVHLQHKVTDVSVKKNGIAVLKMYDSKTSKEKRVCAKHVITGLTADALSRIRFDYDVETALSLLTGSAYNRVAGKTFLVYDRPWWRNEGNGPIFDKMRAENTDVKFVITDKPIGMLLDIGQDEETGYAVLLSYFTWWRCVHFWHPFQEYGTPHASNVKADLTVTESLINQVQLQLSQIFNIKQSDLPTPISSVTHTWIREPFYAGWHGTCAGYNYPEVVEKIRHPVHEKNLYIVGEAFCDKQGWTEGALESVEAILKEYFDIDEF